MKSRHNRILDRFKEKRVLVLGDIMLDHFVRGKVGRISPEAPVPVVEVTQESHVPGGGGNVASNLAALGGTAVLAGVVGSDDAGFRLLADLSNRRIDTSGVLMDKDRPTTQKVRVIAEHQQVVRFDRESKHHISGEIRQKLLHVAEQEIQRCDAVIISDYGKGIVIPQILGPAIRLARRFGRPIVVDPKVEHFKSYKRVTCMTPNTAEAWGGMRVLPKSGLDPLKELGARIVKTLRLESLLITCGENGMLVFESGSPVKVSHIPARAKEVFDVTGAGDTVISALTLALASGATLLEAAAIANAAAGIVVAKLGTATTGLQELKNAL